MSPGAGEKPAQPVPLPGTIPEFGDQGAACHIIGFERIFGAAGLFGRGDDGDFSILRKVGSERKSLFGLGEDGLGMAPIVNDEVKAIVVHGGETAGIAGSRFR